MAVRKDQRSYRVMDEIDGYGPVEMGEPVKREVTYARRAPKRSLWRFALWAVGVATTIVGVIALLTGMVFLDAPMTAGGIFAIPFGYKIASTHNRKTDS
jgi:hypothetical protein